MKSPRLEIAKLDGPHFFLRQQISGTNRMVVIIHPGTCPEEIVPGFMRDDGPYWNNHRPDRIGWYLDAIEAWEAAVAIVGGDYARIQIETHPIN